jgi:DNA-binding beta-propeller fold protein YncE
MRFAVMVGALFVAGVAAGCGSESVRQLPPAAEPPVSPAPDAAPAGRVIPIGHGPEGVVADAVTGRVAVALRRPARLAIVDEKSGRIVRVLRLPGAARHLALAAPGGPVLVPAEDANRLLAVNLRSGRVVSSTPVGRQPHDAASFAGSWFVGDELGATVSMVRPGRPTRSFRVATQPGGLAAVEGDLAVVSVRQRNLEIYDPRTLARVASAPAGVGPTHIACLPRGPCLVTDTQGNALLRFVLRPHLELVRSAYLPGGPYGIALDARRNRLWVTLPALNQLVELPARAHPHALRRFPTVRQPNSVAVDERTGRIFITGRTAGELEWIDPGR